MSHVYSTEPQTTGRVIIETTAGAIDIHLWCKECPTTTRAFLQLCLDGYYDGMIFHRIINDFLIQTGVKRRSEGVVNETQVMEYMNAHVSKDATDIYRKRLEVVPRIKFNHRGLLASALPLDQETIDDSEALSLARQFFITMDEAPFLDKKYVIFGTIRGDTIFNAMRIGKTETKDDNSGEIVDLQNAPIIRSVRIDHHTFHDLSATPDFQIPWKMASVSDENDKQIRKKKRIGKKDLNVLSFGGEMEEMEEGLDNRSMIKSSHEEFKTLKEKDDKSNKKRKIENDDGDSKSPLSLEHLSTLIPTTTTEAKITSEFSRMKQEHNPLSFSYSLAGQSELSSTATQDKEKSIKMEEVEQNQLPKLSAVESRRMKYLNKNGLNSTKRGSKARDDETMAKLSSFKTKMFRVKGMKDDFNFTGDTKSTTEGHLDNSLASRLAKKLEKKKKGTSTNTTQVPVYSGQVLEEDYDGNDSTWLRSTFKCKRHMDHESKSNAIVDRDDNVG